MKTFSSYGQAHDRRQAEIIRSLGKGKSDPDSETALVQKIAKLVSRHKNGDVSQAVLTGRRSVFCLAIDDARPASQASRWLSSNF